MEKKIKIYAEWVYVWAVALIGLAVMFVTKSKFGVSMIVAPAYIISEKVDALTFGMAEYIFQGTLLLLFCIIMRKFRVSWLLSFATAFIYGNVLDLWLWIFRNFEPVQLWERCLSLGVGVVLTSLSIALFFRTYVSPQVYELVVKGLSEHYSWDISKVKICYDVSSLAFSIVLSFLLFGKLNLKCIGIGTIVCTLFNGILIKYFGVLLDRYFDFSPALPIKKYF